MSKTTTLILMAAAMAPLPLGAAGTHTAAQEFAALAAPAPKPATSLEQRAEQFAPAALLPADADMVLVLPHAAGRIGAWNPAAAMVAAPVDSIALGLAEGAGKSIAALRAFHALMLLPGAAREAASEWKEDARDNLADLISQAASRLGQESRSQAGSELSQAVLRPIYLVLSPTKDGGEVLRAMVTLYTKTLTLQATQMPGTEPIERDGLKGVKISGKALAELWAGYMEDDVSDTVLYLQAELSKRTFYLLAGMKGKNAVLVLCEYPEDIRWAASPGQSVLATDAWQAADSCPADEIALMATMSPALCEATHGACAPAIGVLDHLRALFTGMADREKKQAAVFHAAAAGVATLAGGAKAMQPPITKGSTLLVRETPGHIRLSLHSDARGFGYKPGRLRLVSRADAPRNILYAESTEMLLANKPDIPNLLQAATAALEGATATLRSGKRSEVSACMQYIRDYLPELLAARSALLTLRDGLNNTDALVADAVPQTLPFTGNRVYYLPRLAFYSGVGDRAKLNRGWDDLVVVACKALLKSGTSPLLIGALPIDAAPVGNAMSYSLALPFLTDDMGLNVTVSNRAFVIGTSSNLNAKIAASATGGMEFAGAVFSVNFVELARAARSVEMLAMDNGRLPGMDDDDDWELETDIPEAAADIFERMTGTSTVRDGVHILNLDFQRR